MTSRWKIFVALVVVSLIINWRALFAAFKLASTNDEYTHILLILPIAIALIAIDRSKFSTSRPSVGVGVIVLATAVLCWLLPLMLAGGMTSDIQLAAQMLGVVIWWIGSFIISFGAEVSRGFMFPLGFLLWLVPFPELVLSGVVKWLQQGSALSAKFLFAFAGVPLVQNGVTVSIPGLTIEVARECSSIRSSLMLLVTTMVLAQIFLRSPARKALVIALAVPLSVAKNGLRIFTIAMLGTRVDPGFLTGRLHHSGGVVFFAISLAIVFVALLALERGEQHALAKPELRTAATS